MKTAKVLIDVGYQSDGYTFRPDPRSRVWLEKTIQLYRGLLVFSLALINIKIYNRFRCQSGTKLYNC